MTRMDEPTFPDAYARGRRILIRLHSLGDVVLAQPAAKALAGGGNVHFVTSLEYLPVVERMEDVVPVPHLRKTGWRGLRSILREFSATADVVVDLQNNLTTRLATSGMNVTGRFRMNRKLRRKVMAGGSGTMNPRRLDFLRAVGAVEGGMPVLARHGGPSAEKMVGLVAGGRWKMKSIPVGVLAETARILLDVYGVGVVFVGGPDDEEDVMRAAEETRREGVSTYSGEAGLGGLFEVMERLSLLVSPDSGPAHLAAAMGIPVVVVFTSTSPGLGFWEEGSADFFFSGDLKCRPCHPHGGSRCPEGGESCRLSIVPMKLARRAMRLIES